MNTEFTPEQIAFRDSVRDLLAAHASPPALRELWTSETGRSQALWELLAATGVPAILVPEEFAEEGVELLVQGLDRMRQPAVDRAQGDRVEDGPRGFPVAPGEDGQPQGRR